jgi:hypothetical protein
MLIFTVFSGPGGLFAQDDDREPNRADITVQVEQEAEYSEQIMQDYANAQYAAEFPTGATYEDNVLIVFLANEDMERYYCIAWVGNNLNDRVNDLFGDRFESVVTSRFGGLYKYSLPTDFEHIVKTMATDIESLGLESSFKYETDGARATSHLTNHTNLQMDDALVNAALAEFTEKTGIPAVIVLEDEADVFKPPVAPEAPEAPEEPDESSDVNWGRVILIVGGVALVGLAIFLIVRTVKKNKEEEMARK